VGTFPNKETQFSSDRQPESNGRPRKIVSLLKDQGYKLSEINDTLMALLSMDMNELKEAFENPKATVLEKAVAGAIRKSIEKGSLYNIETIITRAMGKPKEQQDHTGEININVNYGHRHNASDTNAGSDLGII
jgi:hypothetical protein